MTLSDINFSKYILRNNGSIFPLLIPSKELKGPSLTNPSIFYDSDVDKIFLNLRNINYTLYHSENKIFEHNWGPLVYIHPESDWKLRTWNIMCELSDDMRIKNYNYIDTSDFPDKELWDFVGLEDARIVKWNGKYYNTGVRRDLDDIGTGRMELSELNIDSNSTKEVNQYRIPVPGKDDSYCEKNWMPISDIPFHYVKWSNGTEIVKYDIETNTTITTTLKNWKDIGCLDLRGGSQVLSHEGIYFTLVHETALFKSPAGRKDGKYRHRFIAWDSDWNLIKATKLFTFLGAHVEFAIGMTRYHDDILITFGFQDNASYLIRIKEKYIHEFINNESII